MKVVRIPIAEARKNLAGVLQQVSKGARIKLTRYNQTLAGVISKDDLEQLAECEGVIAAAPKKRGKKRKRTAAS